MNGNSAVAVIMSIAFAVLVGNLVHISTASRHNEVTVPMNGETKTITKSQDIDLCFALVGCNRK